MYLLLFSCSVMSDSSWAHGLQHARLPCLSATPRACSNSCLLNQWCHPTISSSVVLFSCLLSFPASESFPMSQFFPSGGQSIGASALASVLPMNIQDWYPLGSTDLISLQFKGLPRVKWWLTPAISDEISELHYLLLTFDKKENDIKLIKWWTVSIYYLISSPFLKHLKWLASEVAVVSDSLWPHRL